MIDLPTGLETDKGSARIFGLIQKAAAIQGVTKDKEASESSNA